jgi:two-component system, NarL family, invasion response regulator UvrY
MKILVVDDHAVMRYGCATLLREHLHGVTVDEAETAEEALACLAVDGHDVLLVDVALPGISGIELAQRLRKRGGRERILFYSMFDETPVIRQALNTGAYGYISKRSDPALLLRAVRAVLAGQRYVEHALSMQLVFPDSGGARHGGVGDLTGREFEIFVMLARGRTTADIAEHLNLSLKTVANNISLIKNKLMVSSLAELVHIALDEGVMTITPLTVISEE